MKKISKLLMVMSVLISPELAFAGKSVKQLHVQEENRKIALCNAQQEVKQAEENFLNANAKTRVTLARKLVKIAGKRNKLLVPDQI